jgi:hypothetical protein
MNGQATGSAKLKELQPNIPTDKIAAHLLLPQRNNQT